ncbi:hypothetical protein LO772_12520 [Yinghuangia sp. ASG 101]|uniref:hypothetical protein n=1 Tax=Yinghuangia sp. ASG 101 TaxID=2896848 RepID=UPI001E508946|nr:hypothetical protein [Yinghuangia sp. ASG 101]UGQ14332.1 hypothetical protein LO772_12520 [Yinghuangia sp. ASG 101]
MTSVHDPAVHTDHTACAGVTAALALGVPRPLCRYAVHDRTQQLLRDVVTAEEAPGGQQRANEALRVMSRFLESAAAAFLPAPHTAVAGVGQPDIVPNTEPGSDVTAPPSVFLGLLEAVVKILHRYWDAYDDLAEQNDPADYHMFDPRPGTFIGRRAGRAVGLTILTLMDAITEQVRQILGGRPIRPDLPDEA